MHFSRGAPSFVSDDGSESSTPESSVLALLRDGPVRTLTFAQSTLSIGIFLQAAVLGKQIFDISGHELDLGLLGLAEFLPAAFLDSAFSTCPTIPRVAALT